MALKIGNKVTRNSYGNDVVFKIVDIENGQYILTRTNVRLIAAWY